jgi:hypothetical protein
MPRSDSVTNRSNAIVSICASYVRQQPERRYFAEWGEISAKTRSIVLLRFVSSRKGHFFAE